MTKVFQVQNRVTREKVIVPNVPKCYMKTKDLENKWKIPYIEISEAAYT